MTAGAIWVLAGLAVAVFELIAPGFFLIWIGLAAIGAGAATELFALGREAQFALFVVLTALLVGLIGLRLRRRTPPTHAVNAPGASVVGQTCKALAFTGPEGRVALGDGTWLARLATVDAPTGDAPVAGERLRVVGLDGTVLLVSKA